MSEYQNMFDHGLPCCLYKKDGQITSANLAFCQVLGYTEQELKALKLWQLLSQEQQAGFQQSLATHQTMSAELRFVHKSGHHILLNEHRIISSHDTNGTQTLISQFTNIGQDKHSLDRLQLIEARFNLSQRYAHYGVWDWNIQTNELYWSDQIGPLIGLGDGEVEANYADFIAAIHPEDRDFVSESVRAAVEDGTDYDIEHRVVWPDGTVRWIRETGDVIRDAGGTPLNMIGVARDVTAHRLDSDALKESAHQLNKAQEIAHVGHWSWDVDSGELYWSDEIYRIFGYQPGDFAPTYEKFIATLHPDDVERIKKSEEEAFAKGIPHSIDHRIILPDGTETWVHEEAVAITNKEGEPIRLTGTVQDISERKRLEQQLADKIEQAESANFAKSTFLSHMSHELRTPLNAILGFAQVMQMEELNEQLNSCVKEVMSSGWHLLDLVDDLLDLSHIETGEVGLKLETIKLNDLVEECQSMINPLMQERGLKFITANDHCEYYVQADRRRLKQVIINLLSNAVKYNRPAGEIEIFCTENQQRLRIHIRDTGQGIAKEYLSRIFTPFDRLGKETIEESGSGIGLVLVKRLTETMDGEIGLESIEGEGSTFWVEFPQATDKETTALPIQQNNNKPITDKVFSVLYVEDNPANLRLIEGFMANMAQFTLTTANTATEGLKLARQNTPNIILMDIKLPDMNGFEALAHLKSAPDTADIPVIAVSAVAHEHDVAAGLNAGFFRYITKPVRLNQLEDAMYYALQNADQCISSTEQDTLKES